MLSKLWHRPKPAALPKLAGLPFPYSLPTAKLWTDIDSSSASTVETWLREMVRSANHPEAALINLNTEGGSAHHALALYDIIQLLEPCIKVHILATGMCMSAGMTILMSVPVERRWSTAGTDFMVHPATICSAEAQAEVRLCAEPYSATRAPLLDPDIVQGYRIQDRAATRAIARGTGKTEAEIRLLLTAVDRHFDAPEALKFGFIGHIL